MNFRSIHYMQESPSYKAYRKEFLLAFLTCVVLLLITMIREIDLQSTSGLSAWQFFSLVILPRILKAPLYGFFMAIPLAWFSVHPIVGYISRKEYGRLLLQFIPIVACSLLAEQFMEYHFGYWNDVANFPQFLETHYWSGMLSNSLLTIGYAAVRNNFNNASIENRLLERVKQAELNMLKAQINPHFLFNSFNTLQGLILENPQAATGYLQELSHFYRNTLKYIDAEVTLAREEVAIAKNFISLIGKRYGNNISFDIALDKDTMDQFYLAALSLQLGIENIIKHNTIDNEHHMHCNIFREGVYVVMTNSLYQKKYDIQQNGVGLQNLQARYSFLTDRKVIVDADEKKFTLKLPLISIA